MKVDKGASHPAVQLYDESRGGYACVRECVCVCVRVSLRCGFPGPGLLLGHRVGSAGPQPRQLTQRGAPKRAEAGGHRDGTGCMQPRHPGPLRAERASQLRQGAQLQPRGKRPGVSCPCSLPPTTHHPFPLPPTRVRNLTPRTHPFSVHVHPGRRSIRWPHISLIG